MSNTLASGWTPVSNEATMLETWENEGDRYGRSNTRAGSPMRADAEKLELWESEGGRTGQGRPDMFRILIVDNDMRSADSLEVLLNAADYSNTRVAYSALGALAVAAEFCPNVALLEVGLLDMDSNELAQMLRERAQLQRLRLIAMTDSRQHLGREDARNAGFERYLLKPLATADVVSLLTIQPHSGSILQR
jgi:CheY-like chemotaxis protein